MEYKFAGLYLENKNGQTDELIQVFTRHNGKRCVILSNGTDKKVIPYDCLYDYCNRFPTVSEAKEILNLCEEYLANHPRK